MKSQLYLTSLAWCLVNQTAFAALTITEVTSNPGTLPAPLTDLDWWELTNTGPASVSLDGFEWEDSPVQGDTAVFPNGITVAAGESIIIHRDNGLTDVANAFRADWGLSPSVQILTQSMFTGANPFSGLGSSGDEVNLFDSLGSPVASVAFGTAFPGVSFEWGTNGASLGRSVVGENGAYSASNNRVGSPGTAASVGLPRTVFADTFELATFSTPPFEANVSAELPSPRQSGSASLYTQDGGALIEEDPFGAGSGDWLSLRTDNALAGAVVSPISDFGPEVSGKKYSVAYESRMDESSSNPAADSWQAFGIGDTTSIGAPNGVGTDFGILFRSNGDWSVFLDGAVAVGSGKNELGINTGIHSGEFFDVQFEFDETGPSPTVTGTVTTSSGPVVLGTLALNTLGSGFESAGRFIELRAYMDPNSANPGETFNYHRFDNFSIALGLPGDYNGNGTVDAADYVVWRNGDSPDSTSAGYNLWKANFGKPPGASGSTLADAVPEPAGCVLVMMALAVGAGIHRRLATAETNRFI